MAKVRETGSTAEKQVVLSVAVESLIAAVEKKVIVKKPDALLISKFTLEILTVI